MQNLRNKAELKDDFAQLKINLQVLMDLQLGIV